MQTHIVVVALAGGSSKLTSLLRRLAEELPALLRRRPRRAQPAKTRQTQRRLTRERINQLVREYEAGEDMAVLAAGWSLHRTTVAAHLRRAGVQLRRQGVPSEQLGEAIRLYRTGWSCQRLAERYGCDDETVRQSLKRGGVTLRKPWERPRTPRHQ